MTSFPLDKQTAGYKLLHKGLVRLTMYLCSYICVICGAENDTPIDAIWLYSGLTDNLTTTPWLSTPIYYHVSTY